MRDGSPGVRRMDETPGVSAFVCRLRPASILRFGRWAVSGRLRSGTASVSVVRKAHASVEIPE